MCSLDESDSWLLNALQVFSGQAREVAHCSGEDAVMTRELHQHFHNAFCSRSCRWLLQKHEAFMLTHAEQFQNQLDSRIISQRSLLDQQFRNQDPQPLADVAVSPMMGTPDPANILWLESQKRAAKHFVDLYKAGMPLDMYSSLLMFKLPLQKCEQKLASCTD